MAFDVGGARVTVVGAAASGIAAAALLARRGARVTLSDLRSEVAEAAGLGELGVALELGGHVRETFTSADLIVMSPGVPPDQSAVAAARTKGVPIIGEIELASRWLAGRIVAVTGTKGKSTTSVLIGRMLEAAGFHVTVGGNIGRPLSTQVDETTAETVHVVETSSFQLEQIETFRPWIAVLLNFSPDHLDRHGTVEQYARAKARIFENQRETDWAVVNADDAAAVNLAPGACARKKQFARHRLLDTGVVVEDGWIVDRGAGGAVKLVPLDAIHLLGPHLVEDVMAAAAVSGIAGAPSGAMTAAVETFRGLEHAMELVAEYRGVRFVNDSKATNVVSAIRSIESFEDGVVPILGGRYKGGDFGLLAEPLRQRAQDAVTIGEARPLLRAALSGVVTIHEADSLEAAVKQAVVLSRPGGVVLLAPGCSSFDMFRDYADRGNQFKKEVARLMHAS
jgi:UDP-N-acetylmuramoylalanine--D-glutamate ligase